MTKEGIPRKLAAFLSADVVEYSRLISVDEVGTVQKLKYYREIGVRVNEHRDRLADPLGSTVGSPDNIVNDGVTAQFLSEALRLERWGFSHSGVFNAIIRKLLN